MWVQRDVGIDMKTIQYCTKNKTKTLQFAGYLDSVKNQEIPTKYIQHTNV